MFAIKFWFHIDVTVKCKSCLYSSLYTSLIYNLNTNIQLHRQTVHDTTLHSFCVQYDCYWYINRNCTFLSKQVQTKMQVFTAQGKFLTYTQSGLVIMVSTSLSSTWDLCLPFGLICPQGHLKAQQMLMQRTTKVVLDLLHHLSCLCYTINSLVTLTGSVPGSAASKADTWLLISAANFVAEPENSFELAEIWAWISKPITGFHWLQNHMPIHILM